MHLILSSQSDGRDISTCTLESFRPTKSFLKSAFRRQIPEEHQRRLFARARTDGGSVRALCSMLIVPPSVTGSCGGAGTELQRGSCEGRKRRPTPTRSQLLPLPPHPMTRQRMGPPREKLRLMALHQLLQQRHAPVWAVEGHEWMYEGWVRADGSFKTFSDTASNETCRYFLPTICWPAVYERIFIFG